MNLDYRELPALPPLDAVVHCFWFLRSDRATGEPQPVVADGRLEIVLHAAEPFARLDAEGHGRLQQDALLAGQLTGPIHLLQRGPADVIGIRFRTGAASTLLRPPLGQLTDQVESLAEIDPRLRDGLLSAIQTSPDPYQRRAALSQVLVRAIDSRPDPLAMLAVRSLDAVKAPRIESLAASLGVTVRTLERRMAQATGLAPRSLVRTLRFRRLFRWLQDAEPGTMTQVALASGYFDQAHGIREFRRFTGRSPTEFFGQDTSLAGAFMGT